MAAFRSTRQAGAAVTADLSEFYAGQEGKPKHPKGWEPSVQWNGRSGEITTGPLEVEPTDAIWKNLILDWGLDPLSTRIIPGTVQIRAWDTQTPEGIRRLKYYKASIEPLGRQEDRADVEALCAEVMKRKPRKPRSAFEGDRGLVVNLADWQAGKGEGGGTPAFLERIHDTFDRLDAYIKSNRKNLSAIYAVGLGDLVEGCQFYPSAEFSIDLDQREQTRLVRRLLLQLVDRLSAHSLPIVLGAVAGNHGENRGNRNAMFTKVSDNTDLAVFEQLAEILEHSARYEHVSVPLGAIADDLTMVLDVCGVPVGFAHGHQVKRGSVEQWWQGQALGRQPLADASILVTGHKHSLRVSDVGGGRTWFQCPALDGGSAWWTQMTGQESPSGMLTFIAGSACGPRGWTDMVVV